MDSDKEKWSRVKAILNDNIRGFSDDQEMKDFLSLGTYFTDMIYSDIKHLSFTLSRYKFVSKLLMYKREIRVCELGCQEALGALLLKQNLKLKKYVGIDLDTDSILWNKQNLPKEMEFIEGDFFNCGELGQTFNAVISLDVIEHIDKSKEKDFCRVLTKNLDDDGVAIVGTPSIMMQPYACAASKIAHINLYDQSRIYDLLDDFFENVFIFNMNDEIVNTGFAPMSCYIFAVCTGKRER